MSKARTRKTRTQAPSSQRNLYIGAGVLVVAVIVVAAVMLSGSGPGAAAVDLNSVPDNSVEYPMVSRDHIEVGAQHEAYNSNPPTSGPHYASPLQTNVYNQELPDEYVVHNLEHGHIWLSYRDMSDTEVINLLTQLQHENPAWVIVSYRPEDPSRLVAAAWQHLLTLDAPDAAQLRAFIQRYRDQAPESIPGSA
jgi:hypothetical protein